MNHPFQLLQNGWQSIVDSIAAPEQSDTHSPVVLQALEDRFLYDASPMGVLLDQPLETGQLAEDIDQQLTDLIELCAEEQTSFAFAADELENLCIDISLDCEPVGQYDVAQQLVVIDERVENVEQLLSDLNTEGNVAYQVVTIDEESDAIQQLTDLLSGQQQYDAMHIISHGSDGRLQLGNTELNSENLFDYQQQLSSWTSGLGFGADILIYGCDVAQSEVGEQFLQSFSQLVGADIAASEDLTGHESFGGNWSLEYAYGEITTSLAFGSQTLEGWYHTLDIATGLELHLELNETSGTTASDSSGNGNDGNLTGGTSFEPGEIDGAIGFDYTNGEDYIEILNSASLENVQENDYTLAAWFRPDSTPPGSGSDNDASYGILIKQGWHTGIYYGNDNRFHMDHLLTGNQAIGVNSTNTFAPGQFYHVAGVVDRAAGTVSLYVNGQHEGTSNFTPGTSAREYGTETWRLGVASPSFSTWGWAADGAIDDARIYSRALSSIDVSELYSLPNQTQFFFTTNADVSGGGTPGISSWQSSELLEFGGSPSFEPTGTSGSLSSAFDLNLYSADDAQIDAVHYVTSNVAVGDFDLLRGDVVFSTATGETISGIAVADEDLLVFRPGTPGDLSSGTISLLLDSSDFGVSDDIQALTIAESSVVIGGTNINAGDLIVANNEENLTRIQVTTTGNNSSATTSLFMDAADLGINASNRTVGTHLISKETVLGDETLTAGTLLLTQTSSDDFAGLTGVEAYDVVSIQFTSTGATTAGT